MKVIFVQDIFHNNHKAWIDGFSQKGWDIKILVRSEGYQGHYDYESEFKPSILSEFIDRLPIAKVRRHNFIRSYTIPNFVNLFNYFRRQKPDVIIIKRYTILSVYTAVIAEILNIPTVIYDQYPVYGVESNKRKTFRRLYSTLIGHSYMRISPVKGDQYTYDKIPDSYYVPFAISVGSPRADESYFRNGSVSILFVGKFRQERKRHMLFLKMINKVSKDHRVSATLVGSYKGKNSDYFESLQQYVSQNSLDNIVEFKQNIPNKFMNNIYRDHDIFILPSKDEPAAYSPLEAMSESLPVICSDSNGTKCYIKNGYNGFIFETDSLVDLTNKVHRLLEDRQRIINMGQKGRQRVIRDHQPVNLAKTVSNHGFSF